MQILFDICNCHKQGFVIFTTLKTMVQALYDIYYPMDLHGYRFIRFEYGSLTCISHTKNICFKYVNRLVCSGDILATPIIELCELVENLLSTQKKTNNSHESFTEINVYDIRVCLLVNIRFFIFNERWHTSKYSMSFRLKGHKAFAITFHHPLMTTRLQRGT